MIYAISWNTFYGFLKIYWSHSYSLLRSLFKRAWCSLDMSTNSSSVYIWYSGSYSCSRRLTSMYLASLDKTSARLCAFSLYRAYKLSGRGARAVCYRCGVSGFLNSYSSGMSCYWGDASLRGVLLSITGYSYSASSYSSPLKFTAGCYGGLLALLGLISGGTMAARIRYLAAASRFCTRSRRWFISSVYYRSLCFFFYSASSCLLSSEDVILAGPILYWLLLEPLSLLLSPLPSSPPPPAPPAALPPPRAPWFY